LLIQETRLPHKTGLSNACLNVFKKLGARHDLGPERGKVIRFHLAVNQRDATLF
jgi:hypothetical protein